MKQIWLKLSALVVFILAGGMIFIGNSLARQQQQPPPQGDRPVEQARKNIKVLMGLPDSQLIPVMQFISSALGVDCAHCHVVPQFEKDDKPAKTIARQMIQMQFAINRDNKAIFGDTGAITCYTCHRGRTEPLVMPMLPHAQQSGGTVGETKPSTEPLPTVDQVLAKYTQAIGGEAAYRKLTSRVMKGTHTGADGAALPLETYQVAPDKLVSVMTGKQGEMVSGYNGTMGWQKGPRGQGPMRGAQLEQMKMAADFYGELKLKQTYPNLSVAGREKIGEREAYVLVSNPSPARTHKLYFDTQTGLLLRILSLLNTVIAPVPTQLDFEDYREVDGIRLPFLVRQSPIRPSDAWTRSYTEVKHNVPVDEARFNPPPAPQ